MMKIMILINILIVSTILCQEFKFSIPSEFENAFLDSLEYPELARRVGYNQAFILKCKCDSTGSFSNLSIHPFNSEITINQKEYKYEFNSLDSLFIFEIKKSFINNIYLLNREKVKNKLIQIPIVFYLDSPEESDIYLLPILKTVTKPKIQKNY